MNAGRMNVRALQDCNLVVTASSWRFAKEYAAAIERNWTTARQRNPKLFDGDVFIVDRWSIDDDVLTGEVLPAKFASYLYWRDAGGDAHDQYSEAFASSVIISSDGGILLAQSVGGTLNAGHYGAPGGLLDERDIGCRRRLDMAGAAARELLEETGLAVAGMVRQSGFVLAHVAPYLAIASVFRSALSGTDLIDAVAGFLEGQAEPELEAPRMVYRATELDALPLTPFGRLLTTHVLGM